MSASPNFSWCHHSLSELRAALADGRCTSVELVQSILAQIHATEERVGAYLEWNEEEALRQAEAADRERAGQGTADRSLLGLPIAVKDGLSVAGQSCRSASRLLEGYRAPYDATVVARLKERGAILLGRTNMDEFAMGSTTEHSVFQVTRNPWSADRVPGGSSGGSAAAVAARSAVAALGSDTGGSARQPASFCGCVGLKPTYGRVSRYGLTAHASSLDQVGLLTRDTRDAAWLLGIIAGWDAHDSTTRRDAVPDYTAVLGDRLEGMTLGVPVEYFTESVDLQIVRAVRVAVERCRELGAKVVEVRLPHTPYAVMTYYLIAAAEASTTLARYDGVRYGRREASEDPTDLYRHTRGAFLGGEVKRRILLGTHVLSHGHYETYYLRALKARTLIRRDFEQVFRSCDALLTPVTPDLPRRLGEEETDSMRLYEGDAFTAPANLAGICGCSVPCGFSEDGLPIGLQVLGPALGEEHILRVAHAYEQATDWHTRLPSILTGGGR